MEERWSCCAVHADRGRPAYMRWWGLECLVLTSECHVVISRRYHTRLARMHIDPGTWVQPVNGVILILSSPLASYCFPFSIFSFTHTFIFPLTSASLQTHPIFFSLFCVSSALLSHPLAHPSTRPHGSNSLSGLSHSLQAGRQSLQRLDQKTNSFKQHYIGLAWSMSHTDRWKCWALRNCLYMDMMKTGAGQSFSFQSPLLSFSILLRLLPGCKTELSFVGIRQPFLFVSWSMENKTIGFWEEDTFSLAAVLLDHLLWNHSRVNLV